MTKKKIADGVYVVKLKEIGGEVYPIFKITDREKREIFLDSADLVGWGLLEMDCRIKEAERCKEIGNEYIGFQANGFHILYIPGKKLRSKGHIEGVMDDSFDESDELFKLLEEEIEKTRKHYVVKEGFIMEKT